MLKRITFGLLYLLAVSVFGQISLSPMQLRSLENPAFTGATYEDVSFQQAHLWSSVPGDFSVSRFKGAFENQGHGFGGYLSTITAGASPYKVTSLGGMYKYQLALVDSSRLAIGVSAAYNSIKLNSDRLIFSDQIDLSSSLLGVSAEQLNGDVNGSDYLLHVGALYSTNNMWLASSYRKTFVGTNSLQGVSVASILNFQAGTKLLVKNERVDNHQELILLYPELRIRLGDFESSYLVGSVIDLDHLYGQNGVFFLGAWFQQELSLTNSQVILNVGLRQQKVSVQYLTSIPISPLQSPLGISHQIQIGIGIKSKATTSYF